MVSAISGKKRRLQSYNLMALYKSDYNHNNNNNLHDIRKSPAAIETATDSAGRDVGDMSQLTGDDGDRSN